MSLNVPLFSIIPDETVQIAGSGRLRRPEFLFLLRRAAFLWGVWRVNALQ